MKITTFPLAVTVVFTPMLALAQPPDVSPARQPQGPSGAPHGEKGAHGPGGGGIRPMVEAWKTADANQDGFISMDEFNSLPRIQKISEEKRSNLFKRLDKNADGRLSREEIGRMGKPQGNAGQGPPMQRLWELDTDKSGGISLDEFKAGKLHSKLPPEKQDALFKRLDTDQDGMITPKDRPEPPFRRDGAKPQRPGFPDGGLPHGAAMEPQRIIRQLDKDADGALSFDEFRAGPAMQGLTEDEQEDRFEAMDRNHDKKITREDLPPMPPRGDDEPRDGKRPRGSQKPHGSEGGDGPGVPREPQAPEME